MGIVRRDGAVRLKLLEVGCSVRIALQRKGSGILMREPVTIATEPALYCLELLPTIVLPLPLPWPLAAAWIGHN